MNSLKHRMRIIRTLKYVSLAVSAGIAVLVSSISGCITDSWSDGEPDSFSPNTDLSGI